MGAYEVQGSCGQAAAGWHGRQHILGANVGARTDLGVRRQTMSDEEMGQEAVEGYARDEARSAPAAPP